MWGRNECENEYDWYSTRAHLAGWCLFDLPFAQTESPGIGLTHVFPPRLGHLQEGIDSLQRHACIHALYVVCNDLLLGGRVRKFLGFFLENVHVRNCLRTKVEVDTKPRPQPEPTSRPSLKVGFYPSAMNTILPLFPFPIHPLHPHLLIEAAKKPRSGSARLRDRRTSWKALRETLRSKKELEVGVYTCVIMMSLSSRLL